MPSYKKTVQLPGKKAAAIYEKVSSEIDHFLKKSSIGNFELKRNPDKNEIIVESKMFTGSMSCSDGEVTLQGNLSFMAMPFKGKLDEGIDRWTKKVFSA